MTLEYTMERAVGKMVESLLDAAKSNGKSLKGLTYENFNTFLDDLFNDGGEIRCEQFTDLAIDYALQFGELESDSFNVAQHKCIKKAIEMIAGLIQNGWEK
jgi:hypothetical protein